MIASLICFIFLFVVFLISPGVEAISTLVEPELFVTGYGLNFNDDVKFIYNATERSLNVDGELLVQNTNVLTSIGVNTNAISGIVTSIAGLSTDSAAVASNSAAVVTNADAITANAGVIASNTAAVGAVSASISTNAGVITTNTAAVGTATSAVAAVSASVGAFDGIAPLDSAGKVPLANLPAVVGTIGTNTLAVTANTDAIATLATDIALVAFNNNATQTTVNTDAITANTAARTANAAGVATNTASVVTLTTSVGTATSAIAAVSASVGAVNGIAPLGADSKVPLAYLPAVVGTIGTNAASIVTNAASVVTLTTSVGTATSAVAAVSASVGAFDGIAPLDSAGKVPLTNLPAVVGTIATNAASISTNAGGITTNTASVGTLTTSVGTATDAIAAVSASVGAVDGIAPLDSAGTVPLAYLPLRAVVDGSLPGFMSVADKTKLDALSDDMYDKYAADLGKVMQGAFSGQGEMIIGVKQTYLSTNMQPQISLEAFDAGYGYPSGSVLKFSGNYIYVTNTQANCLLIFQFSSDRMGLYVCGLSHATMPGQFYVEHLSLANALVTATILPAATDLQTLFFEFEITMSGAGVSGYREATLTVLVNGIPSITDLPIALGELTTMPKAWGIGNPYGAITRGPWMYKYTLP